MGTWKDSTEAKQMGHTPRPGTVIENKEVESMMARRGNRINDNYDHGNHGREG